MKGRIVSQTTNSGNGIIRTNAILVLVFTVLMVVMAALAGNGIFKKGDMEWLVTGHQHLGNLLFAMGVLQLVLAYIAFSKKKIGMPAMAMSFVLMVLTFGQIGLGYSTRNHYIDIVGWHIALGVAITGIGAVLSMQLFQASNHRQVPETTA